MRLTSNKPQTIKGRKMITTREQVTDLIMSSKVLNNISKSQAETVGAIFELSDEAIAWLQIVPYKGSLPTAIPTDPLIYRWYEVVNVYGSTIKELIHEEFGDGIMSAIDFSMTIERKEDPNGDRVDVVLSGKFLPYKSY
jgi:cyanate lyase